ncbi:hypothetical protein K227x_54060 [Rubripirellula lacrimiformis]|uniref:DUF4832 domain-containing protein n=1 Tax=Rubripirellula lacrimiformis TaxID=1930273 RepID=A0A517NIN0_9BACT|nr:DUF4832 domain-containing protein [Rubripirellula lacrimiformis]QDT06982.1 hypothetical protein K227x_54060 [Rubripirellula lacrimiformis]
MPTHPILARLCLGVFCCATMGAAANLSSRPLLAQGATAAWRPVALDHQIDRVAPWTGIVLWNDNDKATSDAIQLEYRYVRYNDIVGADGSYRWAEVDNLLDQIASRQHQAILRFYFVYPGKPAAVPESLTKQPGYRGVTAKSEGKSTGFVDWSHPAVEAFVIDFYSRFADRYDRDPRLAYLQTGFGLWGEYHIYDGPRGLGETFPSKAFQTRFLNHLASSFKQTPWMISVDSADGDYSPFEEQPQLLEIDFGVFDDSFLCKQHAKVNARNWQFLKIDRWKRSPGGGEFSYYNRRDQKNALSKAGPNGRSFEDMAKDFHVSFMIGNDQPRYQEMNRIAEAGMATGYRIEIDQCSTNGDDWRMTVTNRGVAPMYHDAYVSVAGKRCAQSLKGLLPGESLTCQIAGAGSAADISIQSDRLVDGQTIPFAAK